ncbi:hypothetical protein IAU60_005823 [Kwoniella sp. DSM 27419]
MSPSSLLLALLPLLPLALGSLDEEGLKHPHNVRNPHRRQLKRSITSNASQVDGKSFDFVIAGGGVAGLTLAARLSEWSNVTVLCVEAGGDGSDVEDKIDTPGYSYLNSLTGSAYDWAYNTVSQPDSGDRTYYWPRGKGLGGSGAINGMFWGRPAADEFDAWATLNPDGAETWNWEEMNKYIKKSENFTAPSKDVQDKFSMVIDESYHGHDGPIQVGFTEYIFDAITTWIPAWGTLGLPGIDLASGKTRGSMFSTSTINVHNQTRSDSKAGYIDPLPPRSNLVILTGQQVTGVLFNGSTDASGNIIASGIQFQAASGAQTYSVEAKKEVLLAGGTVGSPQILQLSGIGPKDTLQALNINSRLDLPVGHNLQDHVSYSMYWSTPQGTFTWNNLSVSQDLRASALQEYQTSRTGLWTYVNEAVGYPNMADVMDSTDEASTYAATIAGNLDKDMSDITSWLSLPANVAKGIRAQYQIQQQWMTSDVGQLEIILTMLGKGGEGAANDMGIQVALQHPWSRGTLFITSTDPFTPPAINPHYFGVGYDIDIMSYGSAFARRLAKATPLNQYLITETHPGADVTGDALGTYMKANSGTEYHPMGTCSMLPKDSGGVVDTSLIVYGTSNLRVIDTSIAPLHLSAHTMAPTYGIAEKASDLIKKKYMKVIEQQNTTSTATNSDEASTAAPGQATDKSVTDANKAASGAQAGNSNLSSGAKIGIGLGAGLGAAAVLGALILLCCIRRKRNQNAAKDKTWYGQSAAADPYDNDGGAYKEAYNSSAAGGQAYPMAAFAAPGAPFAAHSRSHSVDTMATADLASRAPMRSQSGYGLGNSGSSTPYRDDHSDDGHGQGLGGPAPGHQYDAPSGGAWPGEQRYQPVQPR